MAAQCQQHRSGAGCLDGRVPPGSDDQRLTANVIEVPLEWELGRVHTDHNQSLILVLLVHTRTLGSWRNQLMAGLCPDINEDDFFAQTVYRQRLRVDHCGAAGRRQFTGDSCGPVSRGDCSPRLGSSKAYANVCAVPSYIELRSGLKPVRSSSAKRFGCSHAAKCPPLSSLL